MFVSSVYEDMGSFLEDDQRRATDRVEKDKLAQRLAVLDFEERYFGDTATRFMDRRLSYFHCNYKEMAKRVVGEVAALKRSGGAGAARSAGAGAGAGGGFKEMTGGADLAAYIDASTSSPPGSATTDVIYKDTNPFVAVRVVSTGPTSVPAPSLAAPAPELPATTVPALSPSTPTSEPPAAAFVMAFTGRQRERTAVVEQYANAAAIRPL